jgi:uncharacterized protein (DUF58 family)
MTNTMFRTRRRFRLAGYIFLLIMLLVLLAAWNTGTNLFYLVFGSIASFIVMSIAASGFSLRNIHLAREAPAAIYRGTRFSALVRLENRSARLPAISVRAEKARLAESENHDREEESPLVGYVLSLPAGKAAILRTSEIYDRRGVYPLPDIILVTSFPFGLIECRRRISDDSEIVVYPRVLPARTALIEQAEGRADILKTSIGDGDEFFSLREYIPGDDFRRVAWKASARSSTLLVRDLERQTSRFVLFTFDTRWQPDIAGFEDHFESAIEVIASLAFTLLARQYTIALVTSEDNLPEGEGQAQFIKLLEKLARLQPADPSAPNPFEAERSDLRGVTNLYVSADPAMWGRREETGGVFVINPMEVVRA